ncbi:MAG: transcription-repair coupling factor [Clostridia bacterium]|nr:transcription-repair coupling factor [Clostridia bacterium]
MPDLFVNIKRGNSLKEFSECIRQGVPSAAFGVTDAYKNFLVANCEFKVLYVVNDVLSARRHAEFISAFSDKKSVILYPKDEVITVTKAYSKDYLYGRICAVKEAKDADVIIATPESLMQTFPKEVKTFTFKKGEDYSRDDYVGFLISAGYKREDSVEEKATFSLRGDALDIFPVNFDEPVRIDFFGDTAENVKTFEIETHRATGMLESVEIYPAVETVFDKNDYDAFYKAVKNELSLSSGEKRVRLKEIADDAIALIENMNAEGLSVFSSLSEKSADFLSLLPKDFAVVIDEPKRTFETAKLCFAEFTERRLSLLREGEAFAFTENNMFSAEILAEKLKTSRRVFALQTIASSFGFFEPLKIINPKVSGTSDYRYAIDELFSDVKNWKRSGYKVIICAPDQTKANNIKSELLSADCSFAEVAVKVLLDGFIDHESKTALIGSGNIFGKTERKKKIKKQAFFTAPEQGDYCVHEIHGVGRVLGNKKIASSEGVKEYVAVEYSGKDVLYVPVEQMDILTRYLGGEKSPKLSKLGGGEFERVKNAAILSIRKMSFDIKRLYEERNAQKGFIYADEGGQLDEFIAAFPYTDTEDQESATRDVVKDMTDGKVMDRLICGDVGFGKTEVALRAAFLAAINGKQTAVLAPTTILSEQHYQTATKRFKDFGVTVDVINRFKTTAEQKAILRRVEEGKTDVLIGTHRLLSGDIKFKDLGLLILDEEQRFGVEHKEKIKLLKKDVDTLTLSATPIPRTLHMSLSGIRSISTINTPPEKRLPVQTYVLEETDALIRDAVSRELNRGGQTFILYNRVESIFTFAEKLKRLLPGVNMTVTHGQMEERALENAIMSFYKGESSVLITTTIIENGIDLPKANTIIVTDADKLGLSTLYQLKGRVGRSDRLAYAYFTYKREKVLTKTAYERLSAIMRYAEMGSGIKVAMRDLEIRGAGNVLGAEQHGHMDKIGYELYSKLLKEELTGEDDVIAALDVRVSAYIPDGYIESRSAKMDAYKAIAEIRTVGDEKSVRQFLTDAYGIIPEETENLINLAVVKSLAKKYRAVAINLFKEKADVEFKDVKAFGDETLIDAIKNSGVRVKITMSGSPAIEFERGKNNAETLLFMKKFFTFPLKKQ